MTFSYSGVVGSGSGKVSLGSVEGGLGSMKILRDPPKSGWTRRIDKVGETMSLAQMSEEGSDRISESIQVYARGVNPFASVSYSNSSNNGGQLSGGITVGGQVASRLPYSIMKDGAYRPPVLLQQDLLPLSRLRRTNVSVEGRPEMADFTRRLRNCATAAQTKEVHTEVIHAHSRPTYDQSHIKVDTIREPFEVKYVIQPSANGYKGSVTSGTRPQGETSMHWDRLNGGNIQSDPLHAVARTNQQGQSWTTPLSTDPTGMVHLDLAHASGRTNQQGMASIAPSTQIRNTDIYMRDPLNCAATANTSTPYNSTHISDAVDISDLHVRDNLLQGVVLSQLSGQGHDYHDGHAEIILDRNLPEHQTTTNLADTNNYRRPWQHTKDLHPDRNRPLAEWSMHILSQNGFESPGSSTYNSLPPKIQPGGFAGTPSIPLQERMHPQVYNIRPNVQKFNVSTVTNQTTVY